MATIKLTKINIVANKYFAKFNTAGHISVEEIAEKDYKNIQVKDKAVWMGSSSKISFDTTTGELGDNEYATQLNGFHWVKIKEYEVIKIRPEFIIKNALSQKGIDEVKSKSVKHDLLKGGELL